ncbi:dapper homolog 3-like, partial [Numida meleagris]|uniref:dapper homolog 3-like n=1 Tax=Numida meleagris TaxID=8996 RepID=UPI000B3DEDB7
LLQYCSRNVQTSKRSVGPPGEAERERQGLKHCTKRNVSVCRVAAALRQSPAFLPRQRGQVGYTHSGLAAPRPPCKKQQGDGSTGRRWGETGISRTPPSTERVLIAARGPRSPRPWPRPVRRTGSVRPRSRPPLTYSFTSSPDCTYGPRGSVTPSATSPRCRDGVGSGRCSERGSCAGSGASRFSVLPREPRPSPGEVPAARGRTRLAQREAGAPVPKLRMRASPRGPALCREAAPRPAPPRTAPRRAWSFSSFRIKVLKTLQSGKRAVRENGYPRRKALIRTEFQTLLQSGSAERTPPPPPSHSAGRSGWPGSARRSVPVIERDSEV